MSVLIAATIFAWIAIALLGLAVGGLLAQVRALEARLGPRAADPARVVPRLTGDDLASLPEGGYAVVFAESACDVCHGAITELVSALDGASLLIVADEVSPDWPPLPPSVRVVLDRGAIQRSGVPAVPWFATVDGDGRTVESFALGNLQSVVRASGLARDYQASTAEDRPDPTMSGAMEHREEKGSA